MLSRKRRALLLLLQQQQQLTTIIISILIIAQKQQQDMVVVAAADEQSEVKNYNNYLIACGNNVDNSASTFDGRNWFKDDSKYYSSSSSSMATTAVEPDSPISEIPFGTGRVSQANFTYKFPVEPGPKFIRLYFYSSTYNSSSSSNSSITRDRFFFSVASNTGAVLLQNFTAAKATANDSSNMRREFFLTIHPTTSFLELTFSPSLPSYYALVNGIEVVQAFPNLLYRYSDSASGRPPPPPSSVPLESFLLQNFSINEWSSLETMYRVNVGGPEVQPTNDSAGSGYGRMYRLWESDDDGIGYELVQLPDYPPGTPVFSTDILQVNYSGAGVPEYVAPAEVYLTGKQMGKDYFSDDRRREKSNLTWRFEVDVGFTYLVRLHWCEMLPTVSSEGQRVFNVYVNDQVAEENVDLIAWGNGSRGIPIYRDYAVYQQEGGDNNYLVLALRPVEQGIVNVLLNGVEIFKANKSDGSLASPNTDPLQPLPLHNDSNSSHSHPHNHHHYHLVVVIIIIVVTAVVVGIILLSLLLFRRGGRFSIYGSSTYESSTTKYGIKTTPTKSSWWGLQRAYKRSSSNTSCPSPSKLLPSDLCRRFSLNQIRSATSDFSESLLIGSGGFGSVYRGTIDLINNKNDNIPSNNVKDDDCDDLGSTTNPSSSVIQVAVKRLNQTTSKQGAREFVTEIKMLSRLRHAHLVPLIGYCDDQGEMVLVYEYMPRGTLRDHLIVGQHHRRHHPNPNHEHTTLSWERRLSICIGAAKGLHYLHTGARQMVIHRDVKSTNILLDHNWDAKVADFGLSKLVEPPPAAGEFGVGGGEIIQQLPQNGITTAVKGSVGYVDPEYLKRQHLTEKSDVYSFGVVLFEVFCGRPAIDPTLPKEQVNLAMWARTCHRRGRLDQIMDPNLFNILTTTNHNNNIISPSPDSLKKFGDIAETCVREQGIDRPSMADVLWGLEFALQLQTTSSSPSSLIPPIISHHQIVIEDICDQQQYDHSKSNLEDDDRTILHTTTATTSSSTTSAAANSTTTATTTSNNSSHVVFSHLETTTASHQDSNDSGEDFTFGSVF